MGRRALEQIAATGAVRVVDFKAFYKGTPVDVAADPELYARVVRRFPDAIVEDAALKVDTCEAARRRPLSASAGTRRSTPGRRLMAGPPRSTSALSEHQAVALRDAARAARVHRAAQQRGIALYGGGQFELGAGVAQIQALASLFYPDAPNDVAPVGSNATGAAAGLTPMSRSARRTAFVGRERELAAISPSAVLGAGRHLLLEAPSASTRRPSPWPVCSHLERDTLRSTATTATRRASHRLVRTRPSS